jgi:DNA-binding GntR family transcriptional regulator
MFGRQLDYATIRSNIRSALAAGGVLSQEELEVEMKTLHGHSPSATRQAIRYLADDKLVERESRGGPWRLIE